jgi:Zn-dependent protease
VQTFIQILGTVPPLLIAVILHEIAHGYVAERLGDPTARRLGRITLNPLKHIDPFMTIILPGMLILSGSPIIFGGAKPVPVNPMHFNNPRRDMAYVALAGPVTNFILAALFYLGYLLFSFALPVFLAPPIVLAIFGLWLIYGVLINLVLGLFNLLPVPPLDGGRIAVGFLPVPIARLWARLEPFGLVIVILLLFSGLFDAVLSPVIEIAAKHLLKLQ